MEAISDLDGDLKLLGSTGWGAGQLEGKETN